MEASLIPEPKGILSGRMEVAEGTDRMSALPEEIIHHILSFIPAKAAAQTSVLSKTWLHAWSTNPSLDFNQSHYAEELAEEFGSTYMKNIPDVEKSRRKFVEIVNKTLARYREQKIGVKRFTLKTALNCRVATLVDQWVERVFMENRVEEVDLAIWPSDIMHPLPPAVLEAKSLVKLKLFHLRIEDHLLCDDRIMLKFHSLRILFLEKVYLSERVMQILISSCPLIEDLAVIDCSPLKKVRVANLHRLTKFRAWISCYEIVEIDAPRLNSLTCSHVCFDRDFTIEGKLVKTFTICSFQNLKEVCLYMTILGDMFFKEFVPNIPFLEVLSLANCAVRQSISILSQSLRRLMINAKRGDVFLSEVKIDAPNLVSLDFDGKLPCISFTDHNTGNLKEMHLSTTPEFKNSWFLMLRELLTFLSNSGVEVSLQLSVCSRDTDSFNVQDLEKKFVHPSHEIEELHMCLDWLPKDKEQLLGLMTALVDGLFWSCHPKFITVYSTTSDELSEWVSFLREKLMDREVTDCCSSPQIKCWQHDLKDALYEDDEIYPPIKGTYHFPTFETLRLTW